MLNQQQIEPIQNTNLTQHHHHHHPHSHHNNHNIMNNPQITIPLSLQNIQVK